MTAFIKVGDIMEQYIIALILGIIEGITECIPVSSTGHMIIIGHMLNFEAAHADVFAIGTFVSYIVGYITVKVFLWYLNRSSLSSFGYYRIIVAVLAIIYLYL